MIFSKFGIFFLKSKVFTKDNVKYDFENQNNKFAKSYLDIIELI
jgi:hypothetical protein